MTLRQSVVVAICVLINAIDGFDIVAISLASPGIASEWGIDQARLGLLLSAELVGMGLGSIVLGQVADRFGRRPVLIGCLVLMTLGMFGAAVSPGFTFLGAVRLVTGIGIGGMLPCLSAIVAEASNKRMRPSTVAMMAAGYPAGAVLGGAIATSLLVDFDWRAVFYFGAALSAFALPLALFVVPESLASAIRRSTSLRLLTTVNRILHQLGRPPVLTIPEMVEAERPRMADLFSSRLIVATMLLTSAYFLHMISFYFFLKWVPKIVADLGYTAAEAGSVLVWANVGGLVGSVLFSILAIRFFAGSLLVYVMIGAGVFVAMFGLVGADIGTLTWVAITAGFFTNASVVGLYALIAEIYPERLRSGGAGFSLGLGRAGAALGPIAGGALFESGVRLGGVTIIMGLGSLIAALVVGLLIDVWQEALRRQYPAE